MRPALKILPLGAALMLASCGDKAKAPERKAAAGEILGGEVSDAMLPLDSVKSTSPADPRGDQGDPSANRTAKADKGAPSEKSSDAPATATPSASASPAPDAT